MGTVVSGLSEANQADYQLLTNGTKALLAKEHKRLQESNPGATEEELLAIFVKRIEELIGPQVGAVQLPEGSYASVDEILSAAFEVRMDGFLHLGTNERNEEDELEEGLLRTLNLPQLAALPPALLKLDGLTGLRLKGNLLQDLEGIGSLPALVSLLNRSSLPHY